MGRRRWLGGLTEKPQGSIPVSVREAVWGESLAYSVNIIYQGMKKGWKDKVMPRIMCRHSTISALTTTSSKTVRQPYYHYTQSYCKLNIIQYTLAKAIPMPLAWVSLDY